MDRACYFCGNPGHFYMNCPDKDPDVRNFRKQARVAFKMLHPEVDFKSLSSFAERQKWQEEGQQYSMQFLKCWVEKMIDKLYELQFDLEPCEKLTISHSGEVAQHNQILELNGILSQLLPQIKMVSSMTKGKLKLPVKDMGEEERLLFFKRIDMENLRDSIVDKLKPRMEEVKSAQILYEKFQVAFAASSLWIEELGELSGRPEINLSPKFYQVSAKVKELETLAQNFSKLKYFDDSIGIFKQQGEEVVSRLSQIKLHLITCCVCLEMEVKIVFQCGHTTCDLCHQTLQNCPTCRTLIRTRTQLFL